VSKFQSVSVNGFGRFRRMEFELPPMTLLVGANGIGKTAVLDVSSPPASSADGSLNAAISEFGELPARVTHDRAGQLRFETMRVAHYRPLRTRDAQQILRDKTLEDAAKKHPERTELGNPIPRLCGGTRL